MREIRKGNEGEKSEGRFFASVSAVKPRAVWVSFKNVCFIIETRP